MYDRFGIKKFFYKLIDTFTSKKCFRFEQMYLEYEKYVSKSCYFSIIKDAIEYDYNRYDTFISEFDSFRNRFRRDNK